MSSKRYTDEFKIEAVRQVTDRGFKVAEVAERFRCHHAQPVCLAAQVRQARDRAARRAGPECRGAASQSRASPGDRGARHPKKGRSVLCQGVRAKYAFMRAHRHEFRLCAMCRVLKVNRSGYYAWLKTPMSERAKEDRRLLGLIKHHWLASGSVYGHRKVDQGSS